MARRRAACLEGPIEVSGGEGAWAETVRTSMKASSPWCQAMRSISWGPLRQFWKSSRYPWVRR